MLKRFKILFLVFLLVFAGANYASAQQSTNEEKPWILKDGTFFIGNNCGERIKPFLDYVTIASLNEAAPIILVKHFGNKKGFRGKIKKDSKLFYNFFIKRREFNEFQVKIEEGEGDNNFGRIDFFVGKRFLGTIFFRKGKKNVIPDDCPPEPTFGCDVL